MTLAMAPASPGGTQDAATAGGEGRRGSLLDQGLQHGREDRQQASLPGQTRGLDPKTGAILVAAAVSTVVGDDTQYLVINVPTAYHILRWGSPRRSAKGSHSPILASMRASAIHQDAVRTGLSCTEVAEAPGGVGGDDCTDLMLVGRARSLADDQRWREAGERDP
jgi:hypothetical protein